ncbi:hypothetical protein MTR66_20850 [Novosphingobium sp. 2638]|uniref:Succinate dehydrogenase cytochrome b556 subunit n=2 Tax=Novosphingobium beihaiensis TaxID=2930389 RepID=A0ABT0BW10_9SPHN|nr:hypothetical protein [Novosphingobium beihaiensis]
MVGPICAVLTFWLLALHVATGFLDFMIKDGVGARSGMVKLIDRAVDTALVAPLGRVPAAMVLVVLGGLAGWAVYRAMTRNGAAG